MNTPNPEELLNEILAAEDQSDFRRQTLAHGLVALRQRARRRRMVQMGLLGVVPCLLGAGMLLLHAHDRTTESRNRQARLAGGQASSPRRNDLPPVKIINDEQLFALFPDRPLALIGKPGHQQLVFLDRPAAAPGQ
jgi:hypothetical protein